MEVTKHQPGMFSWADMPVLDIEKAQAFYTRLLDVDASSTPVGPGMAYVVLNKAGKSCCALYPVTEEQMQQRGGRSWWLSYFTVEDADATAARAKELGGAVFAGPFDVFDAGRLAIIQDPPGAMFAVWQAKQGIGAEVFGEPGALAWNELYTNDVAVATTFYGGLFGWQANAATGGDGGAYNVFTLEGQPACGMMAIRKEWGPVPPNWSIYLAVEDLETSLELVKEMGGKVLYPPMEVENVGRFSMLQDPMGAYLSVIQIARKG